MKNNWSLLMLISAFALITSCETGQYQKSATSYTPVFGVKDEKLPEFNTEEYANIHENEFRKVTNEPLSTFSIDVDRASYSNVRRFLQDGQLPTADAVRIEEMINYFSYSYPQPSGNDPFSITTETGTCPWNEKHQLVLIGLQGKKFESQNLPPSNLVFLVDVSGSMQSIDKLPLLKESFKVLTNQLRPEDKVSIVVYAGAAGLVLSPTPGSEKNKILDAIDAMEAGGSTAGAEGIVLAYKVAAENFMKEGNNRVILATDGDFNVGVTSDGALEDLITKKREEGIYLTVVGFGTGNIKDSKMELLADKGNGNYAYVDNLLEGKKVFMNEFGGTLFTIAKDVKLQVEFNPTKCDAYRLIGYENRVLANEDFNDDKKDAGEIGAGHTVTAIYEVIPAGTGEKLPEVDALKYQQTTISDEAAGTDEMMAVKIRYKEPKDENSRLLQHSIVATNDGKGNSENFRWAASVAEFGMLLRDSKYKANAGYDQVLSLAKSAVGEDREGYRHEYLKLVETAELLSRNVSRGN